MPHRHIRAVLIELVCRHLAPEVVEVLIVQAHIPAAPQRHVHAQHVAEPALIPRRKPTDMTLLQPQPVLPIELERALRDLRLLVNAVLAKPRPRRKVAIPEGIHEGVAARQHHSPVRLKIHARAQH